jgi:DNA-binding MarR family transcriptional regulator
LVTAWDDLVRAVMGTQRRALEHVEASGMAGPTYQALELLLRAPEHRLPMSRVARELSMTTGGVTKLADRLGRDGLIDRRNSASDRRVIFVVLTPKGVEETRKAQQLYRSAVEEHVIGVLGADRLTEIAAQLTPLLPPESMADEDDSAVERSGDRRLHRRATDAEAGAQRPSRT